MANQNTQKIAFDGGRGFTKCYTEIDGESKQTIFKSVWGDGRGERVKLKDYDNPKYICMDDKQYFAGIVAEKESYNPIRNSSDSKTSQTINILLATALNDVAVQDNVDIMFGVPYRSFRKSTLKKMQEEYEGITLNIKDGITNATKNIHINNISICREGDAALYQALKGKANKEKPVGIINVGFTTTELSYFDKGFVFNDKLSCSNGFGNGSMLKTVQDIILTDLGISKTLNEIDTSNDYDEQKKHVYQLGSEELIQIVEDNWTNHSEMDLYLAGGTSIYLDVPDEFIRVNDPQMATVKGLYKYAQFKW